MNLFEIVPISNQSYIALIIGISCETPINHLQEISDMLSEKNNNGMILFDMIMHTGNSEERFIEAFFNGNNFDTNSFKYIDIKRRDEIRKLTCDVLRKTPEIVDYSILSSQQKKLILSGCYI